MFKANLVGTLRRGKGYDIHARRKLGEAELCPFSPVSLDVTSGKTTVRADSSASRGSADEERVRQARIMVPIFLDPKIGDVFGFGGREYEILSVHERTTAYGRPHHFDCTLGVFLQ